MSKRNSEDSELSPAKRRRQNWKDHYAVNFKFVKPSRKGENFAFCKLCNCDFAIGHGGAHDIKQHEKANKHQLAVSSATTQPELKFGKTRENLDVIRSEVLFTKFLIEKNLPLSVASDAGDLFRTLFPDSTIAKDYSCARTKTVAIINELATDSHNYIVERLKGA
ncbi:hypothetical protein ACJMK2_006353 [Sinanodonta woodiana]|uniref:BED-type domain-containing protein n=2 Tax=Sinanodonta woodiana TaxID=1069815 RepID=A0ABD3VUI8_SINWO